MFPSQTSRCSAWSWTPSATRTSPRWPTAWSMPWPPPTLAPGTAPAGTPSSSGSPCLTCPPAWLTSGWNWCCPVRRRACNSPWPLKLLFHRPVCVIRTKWNGSPFEIYIVLIPSAMKPANPSLLYIYLGTFVCWGSTFTQCIRMQKIHLSLQWCDNSQGFCCTDRTCLMEKKKKKDF